MTPVSREEVRSGAVLLTGSCLQHSPPQLVNQKTCLRCDPTPEVRVQASGLQHGGHNGFVLCNHQGQGLRICQEIVDIYELGEEKDNVNN